MYHHFLDHCHFLCLCSNKQPRELYQKDLSSLPPSLVTVGCSQVFKINFLIFFFFFVLEGSNRATVTLETNITHCLQNKQWYLFSQYEAGRARGSQAILGLTGVLTYCIHSLRQKIVQHEKQGSLKVRAFGWKPQTSA